ncbi:MAG: SdpI family protein [Litorimonas sp.]
MAKKSLLLSLICIAIVLIVNLYTWLHLPDMDKYPIHWNAQGEADGFASRNNVFWALMAIPFSMIFMVLLLYFIPKIEPLRANLEKSYKAYNVVCVIIIILFTMVSVALCIPYHNLTNEAGATYDVNKYVISIIAIGSSVSFILIGNVMGKVRQNFMFGIRTPWTLSSELSWEKTHRVGGRLFVAVGAISLLLTFINPVISVVSFGVGTLALVLFVFVYSYKTWKLDPNRRS